MQKNQEKKEYTILQLMEVLSEKSDDSRLSEEFWNENRAEADELAARLKITPLQAVLFSICLRRGPRGVDFDDFARHLDISNIRALTYGDELNALVRAKYIKYRDAKDEDSFDIPVSVVRALKNNEAPEQPKRTGLTSAGLFDYMNGLYEDLGNDAILPGELYHELKDLFAENSGLGFVICYHQLEGVYRHKSDYYEEKSAFKDGTHNLMTLGLVEHTCDNGQANTSRIHLTDKAKSLLLADFHLRQTEMKVGGLIRPETLTQKTLFYTANNASQVNELHSFLTPERYAEIRARMKENGFRSGFACLFYGAPGTGKTETVYQLARQTGRAIMAVNVPDIKSKWVGESEKNIKEVFDRYRMAAERSERAPILLFNEADAIIGIRHEGATSAVDKMENSIQNIILQEMENLDGIMIATTNLTQNLDSAFERRFLYKICFEKPDVEVRKKIWETMIPSLNDQEYSLLAAAYEFSGGQMENIARKYSIGTILNGEPEDKLSVLYSYCNAEKLDSQGRRRIGF